METVVSGIRSTGRLHLGNYFGAIRNAVKMQHDYNCYFFVADYHSLTTHPNPENLKQNIKEVLATYLACGLHPDKATIYLQSDIPEIPELYLLLNMIAYKGELERCNSFKEKIRKQEENINAGLLTYPVLMTADIIVHRAVKVPVGKDQEQHLEIARNISNRFNHIYKTDFFPEPYAFNYNTELVKVPGLDGTGKMGKSEGEANAIYLKDEPDVIRKKVMRAVTDSGPTEKNQQKPEIIQNLFTMMSLVSGKDTILHFDEAYTNMTIRYGDLKKQLAEDVINFCAPIREKILAIENDDKYLAEIAEKGAEKARVSTKATVQGVREIIGIKYF